MKESSTWYSTRMDAEATLVRWGTHGTPVLLFPTAAGDAEEAERFLMMRVLGPLMEEGRIKVYSVDSVAGKAMFEERNSEEKAAWVQNAFHEFIRHEVVPAIRTDCNSEEIEIVVTGASIGAFHSLAVLTRFPDVFSLAICMSGTYDLTKFSETKQVNKDFYNSSPVHFLPNMPEGVHLDQLRKRFVLLSHGQGKWEEPEQSWRAAKLLGDKGIPNRVDAWSKEYDHDWPTWREMLPQYLREFVPIPEPPAAVEAAQASEPQAATTQKPEAKSTAAKPAPKPAAAKPAATKSAPAKTAAKPAAKAAAKPAVKPAAKPAAKSSAKPNSGPAAKKAPTAAAKSAAAPAGKAPAAKAPAPKAAASKSPARKSKSKGKKNNSKGKA